VDPGQGRSAHRRCADLQAYPWPTARPDPRASAVPPCRPVRGPGAVAAVRPPVRPVRPEVDDL